MSYQGSMNVGETRLKEGTLSLMGCTKNGKRQSEQRRSVLFQVVVTANVKE